HTGSSPGMTRLGSGGYQESPLAPWGRGDGVEGAVCRPSPAPVAFFKRCAPLIRPLRGLPFERSFHGLLASKHATGTIGQRMARSPPKGRREVGLRVALS